MKNDRKLNVIIVDDEKNACINLENMLARYAGSTVHVSGTAANTAEAEVLIKKVRPDAVFLDIDMPGENAFQFLGRIAPVTFEIIFVTAYDEYAIKAFKLNALDYVLKPVDIDDMLNSIARLANKLKYATPASRTAEYKDIQNRMESSGSQNQIILRSTNNLEVINFADIYFIEAQQNYSKFCFLKGGTIKETVTSYTLMEYEELLPADMFFRVHRAFLINGMHAGTILNGDKNFVIVKNEFTIPIARRRYLPLLDFLKNYAHRLK
jgi:two-component system LytT family response regulator